MKVARPPLLHHWQLALSPRHPHQQLDSDFADDSASIHANRSRGWRGSFHMTHDTGSAHTGRRPSSNRTVTTVSSLTASFIFWGNNADGVATIITGDVLRYFFCARGAALRHCEARRGSGGGVVHLPPRRRTTSSARSSNSC
ncbi:hypothetical protein LdCL_320014700 [Leishmania donovani]|uniref:Uncharacterized protein n=1 Tax=Leishmania donovani TaxID=5661 RepID=A0A3S7X5D4_LEIDO|nr:hypothetical protein LdCL_320014700 [Leishmania donovani]